VTRIAVIYYSATGNVHALAEAVAAGAHDAGADVRLRHVEELASEMLISQNQHWGRHRSRVADAPTATLDDLEWADGIAFGTPTRFGNVSAQLKQFIDQAGPLWQDGKLADKVATSFTSSFTPHGGQESTILALNNTLYHWGMLILPLGYTVHEVFAAGGNPYGASFVSDHSVTGPDAAALAVARYQGERLARYATVIARATHEDAFAVRRPTPAQFRPATRTAHSAAEAHTPDHLRSASTPKVWRGAVAMLLAGVATLALLSGIAAMDGEAEFAPAWSLGLAVLVAAAGAVWLNALRLSRPHSGVRGDSRGQ
jgi:NAD(P)H dehydrogenase (quinone)